MLTQINRRGFDPLLLIRQGLAVLGLTFLLSACSSQPQLPPFSASGYVADDGIVRLWRLNNQNSQPQVIMSVYSPYRHGNTSVTFYEYRRGELWQIRHENIGHQTSSEQLRFDSNNKPIFMQRDVKGNKIPLTDDEIIRMQFVAQRTLSLSSALTIGQVTLIQGRWQNGQVTTCQGDVVSVTFDNEAESWLRQRQARSSVPLYISWLDAPEGKELLLVANDNFCKWEPTKDSL